MGITAAIHQLVVKVFFRKAIPLATAFCKCFYGIETGTSQCLYFKEVGTIMVGGADESQLLKIVILLIALSSLRLLHIVLLISWGLF